MNTLSVFSKRDEARSFPKFLTVSNPDQSHNMSPIVRRRLDGVDQATVDSYISEIELLKRLQGKDHIIQLFDWEVRGTTPCDWSRMQYCPHNQSSCSDARVLCKRLKRNEAVPLHVNLPAGTNQSLVTLACCLEARQPRCMTCRRSRTQTFSL
jgi:hypothetical protein